MAVQAQHYHPLSFVPADFRNNTTNSDLPPPQSELTYRNYISAGSTRKRSREEEMNTTSQPYSPPNPIHQFSANFNDQNNNRGGVVVVVSEDESPPPATTSTSGQPDDLLIYHQNNMEIDATIRLQNERLRSGLEESRKKHCRLLMSALECQVSRRLREKDAELEMAIRKNADLQDKIRHLIAENQIWFNVAKNNEAIVSSLKSTLDHLLLLQTSPNNNSVTVTVKEGYGDSDAQSCCFEGLDNHKLGAVTDSVTAACKGCGDKDVCVLLLPCRHLCLCKDCESMFDTCPICQGNKKACLQIFME